MIFFVIFSFVLFLMYAYVGWKFIVTVKMYIFIKAFLIAVLSSFYFFPILSFILQYKKIENSLTVLLSSMGYIGLGVVSLFFFYHIIADIFLICKNLFFKINHHDPQRKIFLGLSAKFIAGSVAGLSSILGFYTGLKSPEVIKVSIPIDDLHNDLKNFTIAHITDTHIGKMIGIEFMEDVVKKIEQMNPDMLVFTGDAADGSVQAYGDGLKPLMNINPPYGKYFVTGNHEYYSDLNGWLSLIEKIGFKILINESQIINIKNASLMVTGIPDRSSGYYSDFHKTDMNKAIHGMENVDLKILLAHQPKDVELATKHGFNLQLSGHTHGGQYFPFSALVSLAHPFLKGLHRRGDTWVYINQGTGFWGPPMRIGTKPEISKIQLI